MILQQKNSRVIDFSPFGKGIYFLTIKSASGEKIGKKIRDTEIMKVPYMLVIGEKEVAENKLSVRRQGKGDMGMLDKSAFLAQVVDEIAQRLAPAE
jgi:threonyl-tRNA synthetase